MVSTRSLTVLGPLLTAVACSGGPPKQVPYVVHTNCAGGGGTYNCTATNPTPQKLGPFDLEFEFANDRGLRIGTSTVTNNQGLEPQGNWEFSLVGPSAARAVRLIRVMPR